MKHRLWVLFLAVVATFCMTFGLVGCNEKTENTGNDPSIIDPSGDDVQGGEQGGTHNPDEGEQGGTQKPDEGEQEPETYTEGLCFTELYGEDGTTVIGYSVGAGEATEEEEIVISSKYNNLPVLSISRSKDDEKFWNELNESSKGLTTDKYAALIQKYTFIGCKALKKITIPNSVTSIGMVAFGDCSGLTSIDIPESVTTFGENAFANCSGLTSVTIPNSVTEIGGGAFYCCSGLTSVTIGSGVTSIGEEAFAYCSGLTSVTVGSGVTSIGEEAFKNCEELKEVHISDLAAWCRIGFEDVNANPLYYAHHLFMGNGEITNLQIPNDVTSIGRGAFYDCDGVTSVTISDSVISIGEGAFAEIEGLYSIIIPDSVTEIGRIAFYSCEGLTSVTVGCGVTFIGEEAFKGCNSLKEAHITNLEAWCKIKFESSRSNPLYYTHHLFIGDEQITQLDIPNGISAIENYAFYWCDGITSVTIPGSVTSIGKLAFYYCSGLNSVTIGKGVTSIEYGAFGACIRLTSITIPGSVTMIGANAFYMCNGLQEVYFENPNGWKVFESEDMSDAKTVEYFSDPATAAEYLKNSYWRDEWCWKREG